MSGSIKLFKIYGIPVEINVTWLFAFVLITYSFSTGAYPGFFAGWDQKTYWLAGIFSSFLLFVSVLIHEMAHSFVALARGHTVSGITLFLFGGVSHIRGTARKPLDEFLIAFSGPCSSIIIGMLFLYFYKSFSVQNPIRHEPVDGIIFLTGWMNIVLGIFNLIPGYPLDGGRVLSSLIWWGSGNRDKASKISYRVGKYVAWGIILWGGWSLINGGFGGGLWTILIGIFLLNAGRNEHKSSSSSAPSDQTTEAMSFPVAEAVKPLEQIVETETKVSEIITQFNFRSSDDILMVASDGEIIGFIGLKEIKDVHPDETHTITAGEIIIDAPVFTIQKDELSFMALRLMDQHKLPALLVVDGGNVIGFVRREDILDSYVNKKN
ncbi:site-2 protease family protein [Dehalococcoidia bacterium]|nr:site-2 protease family protein [Dehalococcoidia bacterium]